MHANGPNSGQRGLCSSGKNPGEYDSQGVTRSRCRQTGRAVLAEPGFAETVFIDAFGYVLGHIYRSSAFGRKARWIEIRLGKGNST
jgi:hypothetical protein